MLSPGWFLFELASTTPPSPFNRGSLRCGDRDGRTSYASLLVAQQQLFSNLSRGSQVVRQVSAKDPSSVQFRPSRPLSNHTHMKYITLIAMCVGVITYIVGQPTFKPVHTTASWYGGKADGLVGKLTASGEPLDDKALTCAMWDVPIGTRIKVTYRNKHVIVRVNDRGPNRKKFPDRGIDLTKEAFSRLGDPRMGLLKGVKLEVYSYPKSNK